MLCAVLLVLGRHGTLTRTAAVYGSVAGILFGLSAALTKPTVEQLHESVGVMLSHWQCYALAVAGVLGFVLQQVSLGTGRLAPVGRDGLWSATRWSGVLLGTAIFDERLSRPALARRRCRDRPPAGARRRRADLTGEPARHRVGGDPRKLGRARVAGYKLAR